MAREAGCCWAARHKTKRWAKYSADRLVQRLSSELGEAQTALRALSHPSVARRMAIAAPALEAAVSGAPPLHDISLRRNVAMHSCHLPPAGACASVWRRAQRGPRLGSQPAPRLGPASFRQLLVTGSAGQPLYDLPGEVWHCEVFEGWQARIANLQSARSPLASSPWQHATATVAEPEACKPSLSSLPPSPPQQSAVLDPHPAAGRSSNAASPSAHSQQPQSSPHSLTAKDISHFPDLVRHNPDVAPLPPAYIQLQACLRRAEQVLARPIPAMATAFKSIPASVNIVESDTMKKATAVPGSLSPGICWCGCWVWPTPGIGQLQRRLQPPRPSASSQPASTASPPPRLGLPQLDLSPESKQHCAQQ